MMMRLLLTFCAVVAQAHQTHEAPALQARIDALPAGATLELEPRTYRAEGLRITKSLKVIGKGMDRTVFSRERAQPFFQVRGKGVVLTMQSIRFEGGGLDAAGLDIGGIKELHLSDLRVQDCGVPLKTSIPGDRFGKSIDGVYARDVDSAEVTRCAFLRNHRDGFIAIPVRHLIFTGCTSKGNGRMGCTSDVDPEKKAGGPLTALYRDNVVEDCGTGGLHIESEPGLPVADATFEHNTVRDCGSRDWGYCWGIVIGANAKGVIRNNTVERTGLGSKLNAYRNGILLGQLGGPVLVEGNTVRGSGKAGIAVNKSSFPVRLVDNLVVGGGTHGISVYEVAHLEVSRCTVEGARQNGLWFRLCPEAIIRGNRFKGNSSEAPGKHGAVRLEASAGVKVLDNDFGDTAHKVGLDFESPAYATQTTCSGNRFEGRTSHPRMSSLKAYP